VAVIATTPLTDNEEWIEMKPGALIAFQHGAPVLGV
jgi:predicted glutamine amidotransferase